MVSVARRGSQGCRRSVRYAPARVRKPIRGRVLPTMVTDGTLTGDRGFDSPSLQRRVCLTSAFHAYRRKDPAFARSVSLDVTRERDVLATSRLALAAFL